MGWNNENAAPRYRILDIETAPHPDAKSWLGPVKVDSRLKDEAKIKADREEKEAAQLADCALHPDKCVIVALGYYDVGHTKPKVWVCKNEDAERVALAEFFATLGNAKLVTFYGHRFDLIVLWRRAKYLGVKRPKLNIDRYKSPHIDLWWELTERGALREAPGLQFYGKRLGVGTLDKVDGGDIPALVAKGDWQAVHDHCLSDIGLTHIVANFCDVLEL